MNLYSKSTIELAKLLISLIDTPLTEEEVKELEGIELDDSSPHDVSIKFVSSLARDIAKLDENAG